ncbi:50S ribosomal protein L28 [Candidatus Hydrogenisulfobacillus filiaventi]|uniref:Large ribosomal subunit protein bL28 n=1 Tax=Candidatus Hydrogenisulfobacillus filiaventi TaxID=2707344 RepID=A0A6F8ZHH9_9FIRM|nr:50S ribosomal protein L28 [Bacillota bacterium]CAB1129173.1 50S ribosomal protein L28 [Candidatus Hydrogenisulfobacillus filiaventi]
MAYRCEICGKHGKSGNRVSHSHHKTRRRWKPNIQRVHAVVDGRNRHIYVCTACLRAGRVTRAV